MPKGFTEHEKDVIRERLIAVGDRLFSAHGLQKTRIGEITAAAKISTGAFYLFYASKEALFLDVLEQAESRFRRDILSAVDLPGPSPRARLVTVLQQAFTLLQTIPVLRVFTNSDYDLLVRRVPSGRLNTHLAGDQLFFAELITRCQAAGIPIQVPPEAISNLLYPLVLAAFQTDAFGAHTLSDGIDALLELVAAFCLGEVTLNEPGN